METHRWLRSAPSGLGVLTEVEDIAGQQVWGGRQWISFWSVWDIQGEVSGRWLGTKICGLGGGLEWNPGELSAFGETEKEEADKGYWEDVVWEVSGEPEQWSIRKPGKRSAVSSVCFWAVKWFEGWQRLLGTLVEKSLVTGENSFRGVVGSWGVTKEKGHENSDFSLLFF